jgi:ABC-type enterochelin transport system substrate-binding protein
MRFKTAATLSLMFVIIAGCSSNPNNNVTDANKVPAIHESESPVTQRETGEVLVSFRDDKVVTEAEALNSLKSLGALKVERIAASTLPNLFVVTVTVDKATDIPKLIKEIKKRPGVKDAEPNAVFSPEEKIKEAEDQDNEPGVIPVSSKS